MSYTIEKLKNNKYKAIVRYKDMTGIYRRKEKTGFLNEESAVEWAKEKDKVLNKEKQDYTLYDIVELDNTLKTHSENTYYTMKRNVKSFYDKIGEIKKVSDITESDITNYLISFHSTRFTGESAIKIIKIVFNKAVNYGVIKKNPTDILNSFKKIKKKEKKKDKFITKEKYLDLIDKELEPDFKLLVIILYNTGMRISEAMGLYKKNIDKDFIYVENQISPSGKNKDLKTVNSYRKIPINFGLHEYIMAHSIGDEYVFKHRNFSWYQRRFQKENITSHMFRHTYATRLIHMNIDIGTISRVIGDDKATIYRKYVEYNKDRNKEENKNLIKSIF